MNKFIRLISIPMEKQKIQKRMDIIWDAYCEDKPEALEEMTRLQEDYKKLYDEEYELRKDE